MYSYCLADSLHRTKRTKEYLKNVEVVILGSSKMNGLVSQLISASVADIKRAADDQVRPKLTNLI